MKRNAEQLARHREAERERRRRDPEHIRAAERARRQRNRDVLLVRGAAYREAHREELRAKALAYHAAHRDEVLRRNRARYQANRDAINAARAEWWRTHPEEARAQAARTRLRRQQAKTCDHAACLALGPVQLAWQTNPHVCYLCGTQLFLSSKPGELGHAHLDHVMPISRGGLHCAENLRPACASCNHRKHKRTPDEFARAR